MQNSNASDADYMQLALRLAWRGQGRTAENPAVGCVLVQQGRIIGMGWTQPSGRPHAETMALASASGYTQGATAYVTLEPCAHVGHTPSCAQTLIKAGITRIVVGCADQDPRTAGKGLAMLRDAGCAVESGFMQDAATRINTGFFRRITHGLPEISVKIATSADEKITTANARSPWITGSLARAYGHRLRAQHQVILTGIGTVLEDDPLLDCRLSGLANASPIRVVLDRELRMPLGCALVRTAQDVPLWVLTHAEDSAHAQQLRAAGVRIVECNTDFVSVMRFLASQQINRVLVEGGQAITSAALESCDRLYWFKAPHNVGDAGLPALRAGKLQEWLTDASAPYKIWLGDDVVCCHEMHCAEGLIAIP